MWVKSKSIRKIEPRTFRFRRYDGRCQRLVQGNPGCIGQKYQDDLLFRDPITPVPFHDGAKKMEFASMIMLKGHSVQYQVTHWRQIKWLIQKNTPDNWRITNELTKIKINQNTGRVWYQPRKANIWPDERVRHHHHQSIICQNQFHQLPRNWKIGHDAKWCDCRKMSVKKMSKLQ